MLLRKLPVTLPNYGKGYTIGCQGRRYVFAFKTEEGEKVSAANK